MSILQPLRSNGGRSALVQPVSLPAPVGGLNAAAPLLGMPATDAALLENWWPDERGLETRPGFAAFATGLGAPVRALLEWSGASGRKLYAAAEGKLHDVTDGGDIAAAEAEDDDKDGEADGAAVTGLTGDAWQSVMYGNSAGTWLVAANGADPVLLFDGETWQAAAITGVSPAILTCPAVWQRRLWFVERGSSRAWYLEANAIQGPANYLDLGPLLPNGGKLVAVASVSFDSSGTGPGELLVFVGSAGDLVLYRGTDPASPTTFTLAGTYRCARPLGDRPVVHIGPELYLLTADGLVAVSSALRADRSQQTGLSGPAAKVQRQLRDTAAERAPFGMNDRWQVHAHPAARRLIVNAPAPGLVAQQWALNTTTGAWCRWSGIDAVCWGTLGDRVFWGGRDGTVYEFGGGAHDDAGAPILADLVTAWAGLGGGAVARVTAVRPALTSNGPCVPTLAIATGLTAGSEPVDSVGGVQAPGAVWNQFNWNQAAWSDPDAPARRWWSLGAVGDAFALRLRVAATVRVRCEGFDLRVERSQSGGF